MENIIDGYMLSPLQKKTWDAKKQGPNFNNLISIEADGELDEHKLADALRQIVQRYEIFRTSYLEQELLKYPAQVVNEVYNFDLVIEDICDSEIKPCCRIKALQSKLITRQFDLETAGLLGAHLLKLSADKYVLFLYCPSIAGDAETLYNVANELLSAYGNSFDQNADNGDTLQFVQYSEWQNEILGDYNEEAALYWKETYRFKNGKVTLPLEHFNKSLENESPLSINIFLHDNLQRAIQSYLQSSNKSASELILTCWLTLLWHHSGFQENLTIGKSESGRTLEVFKEINGLMTKSLPLNVTLNEEETINTLYERVATAVENNQRFQDNYDPAIVADYSAKKNIDVCYEFYETGASNLKSDRLAFNITAVTSNVDNFKLKLSVFDFAGQLDLMLYYHPGYLNANAVSILKDQLTQIIAAVLKNEHVLLKQVMTITENEKTLVLSGFNNTQAKKPDANYIELFEEQVTKTPSQKAVIFNQKELSYTELNERANQFAHYLIDECQVKKENIVAIKLKRSDLLITFILGIMKAGATFLPIDNNIPDDRFEFILKDSDAGFIITDQKVKADLNGGATAIVVNEHFNFQQYSKTSTGIKAKLDDIAYVIYTSGSTGRPKGTLIANSSFTNYLNWFKTSFNINEQDSTLLFSSVAFDLSYTSLWSSLISGSTLHVLEETTWLEPDKLISALIRNKITYIKLTPSHFSLITEDTLFEKAVSEYSLRLIVLGGEKIKARDVERYIQFNKTTRFVNHYGPTEATIGVVATAIDSNHFEEFKQSPVIGKPIYNNKVYILNSESALAPVGIIGELCITGAGVAKGYLNREDLTKEKFIDDPFTPGQILYKTGDLARWLADGQIQLIGRNDGQVKIRGYRVEVGEIEKVLIADEQVLNAAVLAFNDDSDDLYLRAFLLTNASPLNTTKLKERISAQLPEYMVPAHFIVLESFPLLPNGKINRKELINIKVMEATNELNFEKPVNDTEEQIAAIWKKILLKDVVSTNESFFNVGGNSLKLVKVFRELSKLFPNKIVLTDLFKYSSIQTISNYINTQNVLSNATAGTPEAIESFDF